MQIITSFEFPVFALYIVRKTSNASSCSFIVNRNLGVSGINVNAMAMKAFTEAKTIKKQRHGTKLMKKMSTFQFIGIKI